MKKRLWHLLVSLLLFGGVSVGQSLAHPPPNTTPPAIKVSLALDKPSYLFNNPGDPIKAVLTIANVSDPPTAVITSQGFSSEPFQLFLTFIDPEGKGITANELGTAETEGPLPQVIFVNGVPLQVEEVETLASDFTVSVTLPDAAAYYTFTQAGPYSVKAFIRMRTYPTFQTIGGVDLAELESATFAGTFESNPVNFSLIADADEDGYAFPQADPRISSFTVADCEDRPEGEDGIAETADDGANIHPGASETLGNGLDDDCNPATPDVVVVPPGLLTVQVDKHTVGSGNHPGSTKEPIAGLVVRVFDKSTDSCAMTRFGVSWQYYKSIWLSCLSQGDGTTDASGRVSLEVAPGNYLVIGEYDPDGGAVGNALYPGVSAGELASGETVQKYLQVIVKANGKTVPAKYTKKTGSELLIIEPEYVEWDGTQELYPFIFDSIGDWTVTTSVNPPQGFVADQQSLTEEVNTELEAVQFLLTDVGSEWVPTEVTHKLKHKGKSETVHSQVEVKLSEKLAKEKGLDRSGKPKKAKS